MGIRSFLRWLMLCSICVGLWGCGQAKPAVETTSPISPTSEAPPVSQPVKNRLTATPSPMGDKPSPLVATAAAGTAEAAFQQTLVAFQEGRLDSVFDNLPASYQMDAENIVHEFAEKMDADLWAKIFALLDRVADILKTKKSLILNLDNVKKNPQFETIRDHWDSIVSGLQEVVNSEVADIKNLKKCNLKRLLGLASRLLISKGLPLPKFGEVSVTTIESNAETATLSYRETKDAEPKQVEFVKIEGKWLPKSIATSWSEEIANVRSKLAGMPGLIASIKPIVVQQLDGLNGILDQIDQAKTSEQFSGAIMPLFFSIALGQGFAEQALRDSESKSRKSNAVQIVVNRELNDDDQTKLKDAILAAINDANVEYEIIPNDGKTRFRFTPVADSAVIVAVIQKYYEGARITQESDTKMIRVELK